MVNSLKPTHLQIYKNVGLLLFKLGQADFVERAGLKEFISNDVSTLAANESTDKVSELVSEIERLGPAFIAIGKVLSNRPDILPVQYATALARLDTTKLETDNTCALPFVQMKGVINSDLPGLNADLRTIDQHPLKVCSLSQSYRAVLNNGKQVIIKIQRPSVREKIVEDLSALDEVAHFCDSHTQTGKNLDLAASFDSLRKLVLSSLDYRQTANNLSIFKTNMDQLDSLVVPAVFEDHCSQQILVSEHIDVRNLSSVGTAGLLRSERQKLAKLLAYVSFKQSLLDGFINSSLNDSNVAISKSGHLVLMGEGPFIRVAYSTQEKLVQIISAIRQGKIESALDALVSLARKGSSFNHGELHRQVEEVILEQKNAVLANRSIGADLIRISKACTEAGLKIMPEIPLMAGCLYNLEHCALMLDEKLDSASYLDSHLSELAHGHMKRAFAPQNLFHNAVEMAEIIEKFPGKVSRILDSVADNDLKITVHAIDEQVLIKGFQKIANRIALALVLAALIMGASLLMQVRTSFTIWGYPGLAMLCFMFATFFGFTLVVEIMISDRR